MKRGQIRQVFIWITILILAGLILIFGLNTVKNTQEIGDEVLVVNFFKNFKSKVNNYYFLSSGSSGVEDFNLPGGVSCVCFTNGNVGSVDESCGGENTEEIINGVIDSDDEFNMFLVVNKEFQKTRDKIENLDVTVNPTCFNVNGRLEVKLENVGDKVVVQ